MQLLDEKIKRAKEEIRLLADNNQAIFNQEFFGKINHEIEQIIDAVDQCHLHNKKNLDYKTKLDIADSLEAILTSLKTTINVINSPTENNITAHHLQLTNLHNVASRVEGRPSPSGKIIGAAMMALGVTLMVAGTTGILISLFIGTPTIGVLMLLPLAASAVMHGVGVALTKIGDMHYSASSARGLSEHLSLFACGTKEVVARAKADHIREMTFACDSK